MCYVADITGIYPANTPTSTNQLVVPNYDPSNSYAAVFSLVYDYNGTGTVRPTGSAYLYMSVNAATVSPPFPIYTFKQSGFMFICFSLGIPTSGLGY